MKKNIILLTKSRKHSHYCTAGIEIETGNWIRIVSDNHQIQQATTEEHMRYESGQVAKIFDKISIECKHPDSCIFQPENFVLNQNHRWNKLGTSSLEEVLSIHSYERKQYLFYDSNYRISNSYFDLTFEPLYSLILIRVTHPILEVKEWQQTGKKSLSVSFDYMGQNYKYIRITDTIWNAYLNKPDGNYLLPGHYAFVVSLGEKYADSYHYKLIAKVFEED